MARINTVVNDLYSKFNTNIGAQEYSIVDIVSVDPFLRFATVKYGNSVLNNVIVPNTITVGNVQPGDSGLLLRTQNGLNILLHTFSISTNTDDMVSFVGGIKVGTHSNFLPSATVTPSSYSSSYEFVEVIYYDEQGSAVSSSYEISYDYEGYEIKVAEDTYAGEIRAFNSNLYSWCSSYTTTYSQYYDPYNTMYGFNPEWVKWDDARFIQGIPVVDKKPSDNDTLVFDNTIGMYRPGVVAGVVGCTLIASAVLTANATSVTFSNIPGIYTDLMLTGVARTDRAAANDYVDARVNGDAGTNYDRLLTHLYPTTYAYVAARESQRFRLARIEGGDSTAGAFSGFSVHFPGYANNSTWKPANSSVSFTRSPGTSDSSLVIALCAGMWKSTAAITSLALFPALGTNFVTGSRFYLWGLK